MVCFLQIVIEQTATVHFPGSAFEDYDCLLVVLADGARRTTPAALMLFVLPKKTRRLCELTDAPLHSHRRADMSPSSIPVRSSQGAAVFRPQLSNCFMFCFWS